MARMGAAAVRELLHAIVIWSTRLAVCVKKIPGKPPETKHQEAA